MRNKILSNLLICFSFVAVIILQGFSYSQITSTSPYSSYGLGQRDGMDHAAFAGLGTTTVTYFDSTMLNFFNPATYNTLAKGQPLFSTGVSSRLSWYNDSVTKSFSKAIVLNHFSMGFSFAKHFGLAFGLKPFSRRGYQFTTKDLLVTDSIQHTYIGSGSTSEVFLGLSTNVLKTKNYQISVGGNIGYVFGTLTNERRSNIIGSTAGGVDQKTLKINSLHYELGFFYKHKINEKNTFVFSGVIEPSQKFSASQSSNLYYSKFIDNSTSYVKLDSVATKSGDLIITPTTTLGINYIFSFKDLTKKKQERNSEISMHASYSITNWKDSPTTFSGIELNPGNINTNKLTVGLQYTPEKAFLGQSSKSNPFETIRYRFGYYQYTLPMLINSKTLIDKGLTIGFGIPIRIQKSLSSVNIGATYGKRGDGTSSVLNEKYLGVNISVIFAPASFERWFVKRKLD